MLHKKSTTCDVQNHDVRGQVTKWLVTQDITHLLVPRSVVRNLLGGYNQRGNHHLRTWQRTSKEVLFSQIPDTQPAANPSEKNNQPERSNRSSGTSQQALMTGLSNIQKQEDTSKALLWMVAKSISHHETLVSDDSPVNTSKQWFNHGFKVVQDQRSPAENSLGPWCFSKSSPGSLWLPFPIRNKTDILRNTVPRGFREFKHLIGF